MHHTQTVELFRDIVASHCSLIIWLGCEENSTKYSLPFSPGIVMCNGCEKSWFSTNISAGDLDCAASLDKVVQLYNETLTALLDVHALVVSRTARLRPRTDPWFDNDCREAKKRARRLERRYKRHGSDYIIISLSMISGHPFGNLKLVMQRMPDKLGGQYWPNTVSWQISLADLHLCWRSCWLLREEDQ